MAPTVRVQMDENTKQRRWICSCGQRGPWEQRPADAEAGGKLHRLEPHPEPDNGGA